MGIKTKTIRYCRCKPHITHCTCVDWCPYCGRGLIEIEVTTKGDTSD